MDTVRVATEACECVPVATEACDDGAGARASGDGGVRVATEACADGAGARASGDGGVPTEAVSFALPGIYRVQEHGWNDDNLTDRCLLLPSCCLSAASVIVRPTSIQNNQPYDVLW